MFSLECRGLICRNSCSSSANKRVQFG